MNKKVSLGTCISLVFLVAAICISCTMYISINIFNKQLANVGERAAMLDKFSEMDQKVRQNYAGIIDEEKLNNEIARGYIEGIGDKYAVYFTNEEYNAIQNRLSGKDSGIGVRVCKNYDDTIYVFSVIENTPAYRAGLLKGDIITSIEGRDVKNIGYDKGVGLLSGKVDENIKFKIIRNEKELDFDITKGEYVTTSVEYRKINDIGYIKIYEFGDKTLDQFKKAINQFKMEKVNGLVFDVRNNPGGTLDSVSKIIDILVPAGTVVSSTGKDGKEVPLYTSDSSEIDMPMIVLCNENSASAAELFTCALRDFEKAKIVGEQTYGKGSMQSVFKMSDGSAVDLTVARYNPPKSPNFEGVGIKPDFEVILTPQQKEYFNLMEDTEDDQLVKAFTELDSTVIDEMAMMEEAMSLD